MSQISRYVLREVLGASVVVAAVLLTILMSNQFAEVLGDAAADTVPTTAILEILRLQFLRYLTLLAPASLLLGILLALARLNRDSEMAALGACGIGPLRILRPIGLLTAVLAAVIAWLALVTMPAAMRRIEEIRYLAREVMDVGAIESGRFWSPDSGRTVIYVREVEGDQLHGVFIQREQNGRVMVVTAERGERLQESADGDLTFRLFNGRRTEGTPGDPRFLVVDFPDGGVPIRTAEPEEFVESAEQRPTLALVGSKDPLERAELEWRLGMPLSLFVVALLAVPLSRSAPREGRYARVGIGMLLWLVYSTLLSMSRVWIERGDAPPWFGMWVVHAALALFALALLSHQNGLFAGRPHARSDLGNEPAA